MESWKITWRASLEFIGTEGLKALRHALDVDDDRLIQGATCTPPPLQCVADWPVEAACLWTYAGVMEMGGFSEGGLNKDACTVGEAESWFATICSKVDTLLGEPAACRYFLTFWDETPRNQARRLLLEEVRIALEERANEQTQEHGRQGGGEASCHRPISKAGDGRRILLEL